MVKLHRHFDTSNNIFLLLEYASGGSLWNYVNNSRQHVVDSNEASGEKLNDAATKEKEIDGHPTDVRTTPDGLNLTRCEVNSTRGGVNSAHSCVNSTRDGVGEEIEKPNCEISDMVFINKPGNSSPDILTSSIDLEQTTTSLLIKNSDKEIKTEISEGKYITSENKANTTDIGGNLCSTDSSSVDKRCLNQGTSSEWRDHDTDCSHEILSCLDHVTKSNLVTEECVQCWIAELLLAVASIHSCGIILKYVSFILCQYYPSCYLISTTHLFLVINFFPLSGPHFFPSCPSPPSPPLPLSLSLSPSLSLSLSLPLSLPPLSPFLPPLSPSLSLSLPLSLSPSLSLSPPLSPLFLPPPFLFPSSLSFSIL